MILSKPLWLKSTAALGTRSPSLALPAIAIVTERRSAQSTNTRPQGGGPSYWSGKETSGLYHFHPVFSTTEISLPFSAELEFHMRFGFLTYFAWCTLLLPYPHAPSASVFLDDNNSFALFFLSPISSCSTQLIIYRIVLGR